MSRMSVTHEVFQPERSRDSRAEQRLNMERMSVTPEVDKEPTIEVRPIIHEGEPLLAQLFATHPSSSSRYLTPFLRISSIKSDHSNAPSCTRMAPSA